MTGWIAVAALLFGGVAGAMLCWMRARSRTMTALAVQRGELAAAEKASLAEVELNLRLLRSSLDSLSTGLIICDREGQVMFRNRAAEAFVGARHGEALVAKAITDLSNQALTGTKTRDEIELQAGRSRTYHIEANPISSSSQTIGAVATVRDITEQRRITAVRRDFVANVSHELKTPIAALSLLAEALTADADPNVTDDLVERIGAEAERLGNTIDDLMTLAYVEDHDYNLAEPVDVYAVVAAAIARISAAAKQQDISLGRPGAEPSRLVRGSRIHLESALFNLLDNAVKYSEPGGTVEVNIAADPDHIVITITDNGIGIPRDAQSRIFERFYRVDKARSRQTGGTGLGLSIVRHVVVNHGGDIEVRSREGEGSTFTVRLPSLAGSA